MNFKALPFLLACLLLPACSLLQSQPEAAATDTTESDLQQGFVQHVVLIWLKEPGNAEHRQHILNHSEVFRDIPGVVAMYNGEVIGSDRPVVEDSYDVALSFLFKDKQALYDYLVHPLHKQTVKEEFLPLMERFQVVDFGLTADDQ